MKTEYCIMEDNPPFWRNFRFEGSHRHEIFGGMNRQRSIKDGLVIFLTPEMHNMSNRGIHFDKVFDMYAKTHGQLAWMLHYDKTIEDFRKEYGKSYL